VDIDNEEAVAAARSQQSGIEEVLDEDAIPSPQEHSKENPPTSSTSTQLQSTDGLEYPF
jgi:hypothetical protein